MRHLGMFDWYEPDPPIKCVSCDAIPNDWQGKEGPNALFVWRQGEPHPIGQRADEPLAEDDLVKYSLPDRFRFYTICENGHELLFQGRTTDGVWTDRVCLMA